MAGELQEDGRGHQGGYGVSEQLRNGDVIPRS